MRRRIRRIGASSFGPLVLSASVALALARLISHDLTLQVLLPVVVAIVIADVATAVAMRFRATLFLAAGIGWLVALVGLALVVDPSLANPGAPLFLHASVLSDQLRAAHNALANDGTPLPNASGVILIFGAIGAAAAALTRGVWSQQRRVHAMDRGRGPLSPTLAPSLAIFIYSTLVSAEQGRVAAIVCYFLGVLIFIGLADRPTGPVAPRTFGVGGTGALPPRRRWPRRARLPIGATIGALVMALVVVAAGAGLSGMRLNVFHVNVPKTSSANQSLVTTQAGHGVPQHLITGISLVDHLLATEITESHTVIFRVTSPVTTYWQVGVLSSFSGSQWLPSPKVRDALAGSARSAGSAGSAGSATSLAGALGSGSLPTPNPTKTFTAQVTVTDFASRLLPAPPHTVAVQTAGAGVKVAAGAAGVIKAAKAAKAAIATAPMIIGEEGVLTPSVTTPGTKYRVTAALDTSITPGANQLSPFDARLAPYLELPKQPAAVTWIAHVAAGSATTPAAEAQALVNWFRSGRFHYTLTPPRTTGSDPLLQFLTVTKAGFCEQFAGAYGVLARALGIPTRLAVGFTAGQAGAAGSFTVTGADAHVWPQVYLGPDAGWVSVEPTPPSVAGSPAAEGVVGATGAKAAQTTGPKGTPTSAVPPTTTATTPSPKPTAAPSHHRATPRRPSSPPHSTPTWWMPLAVVVGLLVLAASVILALRRRRASAEAALPPDQRVVRAWERALGALGRSGLLRRAEETPGEYAARVRSVEDSSALRVDAAAVANLAALVELACYTPRPCTPAQACDALALAAQIVEANRPHRRRGRRHWHQAQDQHQRQL
jgi:transglutaminase-like putative cysteine protease